MILNKRDEVAVSLCTGEGELPDLKRENVLPVNVHQHITDNSILQHSKSTHPFVRECLRCQLCKGIQLGSWPGRPPRPRRLQGPLGALPCERVGARTGGTYSSRRGPLDGGVFAPVGPRLGKGVRGRQPGNGWEDVYFAGNHRAHVYR